MSAERDELIEQAAQAIKAAIDDPTAPPTIVAWQAANAIITKGWRPSPSGDVAEQAAQVMQEHYIDAARTDPDLNDYCVCGWASAPLELGWEDHLAEALADAGLLRTPPQQDAHEVYRAWNEEGLGWVRRRHGAGTGEPVAGTVSAVRRGIQGTGRNL